MLISFFISPVFATEINNPATCDSGTLSTDTGPTNLRANYESNTLNLKWYDENNNRINVQTESNSCTYGGSINLPTPPTKKGYTFKGWKVLPYKPIEYIESTGTQYIDTGYFPNNNTKVEIRGQLLSTDVLWPMLFGAGYIDNNINHLLQYSLYSNKNHSGVVYYTFGTKTNSIGNDITIKDNDITIFVSAFSNTYTFITEKNTFIIDNLSATSSYSPTFNIITTMYLFARNLNNSAEYITPAKIYYFKIWDNGTLVRDMIPVKDSNGVVCMYDEVSKQYFYNAGSGNFIAGPDL